VTDPQQAWEAFNAELQTRSHTQEDVVRYRDLARAAGLMSTPAGEPVIPGFAEYADLLERAKEAGGSVVLRVRCKCSGSRGRQLARVLKTPMGLLFEAEQKFLAVNQVLAAERDGAPRVPDSTTVRRVLLEHPSPDPAWHMPRVTCPAGDTRIPIATLLREVATRKRADRPGSMTVDCRSAVLA